MQLTAHVLFTVASISFTFFFCFDYSFISHVAMRFNRVVQCYLESFKLFDCGSIVVIYFYVFFVLF